jgi:hypothetical protein
MKTRLVVAALLGASALGGCATYYPYDYAPGYTYYYDYAPGYYYGYGGWGYDRGGYDRHGRGGRSEPGNEAGMYPAYPSGGHGRGYGGGGGGGGARGGEAGG